MPPGRCIACAGGSTSLTVTVEHKNVEDTSWTTLTTLATLTTGVNVSDVAGIKEQLRYAFVVNGASANLCVYANVLAPAWRPY